jgi:hypothetical protein
VKTPDVPVRQQSYRLLAELTSLWPKKLKLQLNYRRCKYFLLLLSGPILSFSISGEEG